MSTEELVQSGFAAEETDPETENVGPTPWFKISIFSVFSFSLEDQLVRPALDVNIKGECSVCKKTISGRVAANGNFTRHYKKHTGSYLKFKEQQVNQKKLVYAEKRKKSDYELEVAAIKKRRKLEFFVPKSDRLSTEVTQDILEKLVKLIVADALPLSHVESYHFRQFVNALNPKFQMICAKTLATLISRQMKDFKVQLKSMLTPVSKVCLTADAWSSTHRAFLGVTLHWLDEKTLKRSSRAIALKRFIGSQTYDRISCFMREIINEYDLVGKVQNIVTDNGLNFVKAMKTYLSTCTQAQLSALLSIDAATTPQSTNVGATVSNCFQPPVTAEVLSLITENQVSVSELSPTSSEPVDPPPLFDLLSNPTVPQSDDDYSDLSSLPSHIRCASHTLNLLATTYVNSILTLMSGERFAVLLTQSTKKMQSIWSRCNRSTKACDITKTELQRSLPTPGETRWNSTFDCMTVALKQVESTRLNNLCLKLKLAPFTDEERSFLLEYLQVMEPIAIYLDEFQREKNCYLGVVLPTLVKLKDKLTNMQLSLLPTFRKELLDKLDLRFGSLFSNEDYILAAVSHPKYKFNWIKSEESKLQARRLLAARISSFITRPTIVNVNEESSDGMSSFDEDASPTRDDIALYLADKNKKMSMLDRHLAIKSIFVQFNTAVPSSAPVERLFSVGSIVLTGRRNKLSDLLLEYLILLKIHFNSI